MGRLFRFELDLRALAALRISLGLVVLFDLLLRLRDLTAFYTDQGVLPRVVLLQIPHPTLFDFLNTVGTNIGVLTWFGLLAAAAFGVVVGWRTRACLIVVWVLHTALKHRNPLILHAGDLELGLILFWSIFLPLGARYSFDARSHPKCLDLPDKFSSVATTGYVLQLGLMYLMAALHKNDPVWTDTGQALYYTFNYDQFSTSLARLMLDNPQILKTLTFVSLGMEFAIPVLLWFPWKRTPLRYIACVTIILFHCGVALTLNLGIMVLINIVATIGLWPGAPFDRLATKIGPVRGPEPEQSDSDCRGTRLSKPVQLLLALNCLYIVHLNYAIYNSVIVPTPVKYFGYLLRQQQNWDLFAPHPGVDDGWFVLEGHRLDGKKIDLLQGGKAATYQKPESVAASFPNQRWRMWLLNLQRRSDPLVNEAFASYLARKWNRTHRGQERVSRVSIVFVSEPTPQPGQDGFSHPVVFFDYQCPVELYHKPDEAYIP